VPRPRLAITVIALSLAVASCSDDMAAPTTSGAATTAPFDLIFADEFERVCRGIPALSGTAYERGTPGLHPLLVFRGEHPEYGQDFTSLADGWVTTFGEFDRTELVACLNREARTSVGICSGYETDDGTPYSVERWDASYAVMLYRATTAQEVARDTWTVAVGPCPTFVLFSESEPVKPWYGPYTDLLEAFLAPHVSG
jgi:hypothetical protein